jgi:hypothetical protein
MAPAQELAVRVRPGFEEHDELTNEPFERPGPADADAGGEHDFGSVPPSALAAPTTIEH